MSAFSRALLKPFVSLLALMSAAPAEASPRLAPMGMPGFMRLLRDDASLRRRFARDPQGVLREAAIDLATFELPPRIDEAWLDGFLADWAGRAGPRAPTAVAGEVLDRQAFDVGGPPAPVYGPPPTPVLPPEPPDEAPPPAKPPVQAPPQPEAKPEPHAPMPVYGPPGGFRR